MGLDSRPPLILLAALWTFAALGQSSSSQQAPGSNSASSPKQSATATSSGVQSPANLVQRALENPLLEQEDEERNITYMESHISFEYRHDRLDGGSSGDTMTTHWQQSFGSSHRMAAGIEVPIVHASGEQDEPSANGVGDIKLDFRGMIGKGEKFEHAAGIEITLPSASNDEIGDGEVVLRFAWGCTGELTAHTLLSAELGYNKAVENQRSGMGTNSVEPELILSQAFTKRFGGYLDWDSYYDFSASQYVQTLQAGLEIALDRQERWTFAPYVEFPLNHAARIAEFENAVGFVLNFTY
jgi:hypothetical protein